MTTAEKQAPRSGSRRVRVVDPAKARELGELSAMIRGQQEALRMHEEKRNALVRAALAAGWTHAQISEATGLTRGRIGQIAQRS